MNIQLFGEPPQSLSLEPRPEAVLYPESELQPLFAVDGAIFFPGADAGAMELLRRSGRPFLEFAEGAFRADLLYTDYLEQLRSAPRTNYQPIDCNFYDNFEAAIVRRRTVALSYLSAEGEEITASSRLRDLKTHRNEEFVQLASGEWLRLDRIVAVDGVAAGSSCTFPR